MGKKKLIKNCLFYLSLILLMLFLNACEYGNNRLVEERGNKRSVIIFEPQDGSLWAVGDPISIQSRLSAPDVVLGLTLFVNGQQERPEDLFAHPTFTRGTIRQIWTPDQAGTYQIQTLLRDGGGTAESNIITINVGESQQSIISNLTPATITSTKSSFTPTLTITPTLTFTPTLTLTPETGKPEATANQNLNCRRGPSTEYESLWYFMQGETTTIEGRSADSSWLVISRTDGGGQCWVSRYYVTVAGEISAITIITPPPLPATKTATLTATLTATVTEMPYTSCADYPDLSTCNDDPMGFGGCSWSTGLNVCEGP